MAGDLILRGHRALTVWLAGQARAQGTTAYLAGGSRHDPALGLVLTHDWAAAPQRNQTLVVAWDRILRETIGASPTTLLPVRAVRQGSTTVITETIGGVLDLRALLHAARARAGPVQGHPGHALPVLRIRLDSVALHAVGDAPTDTHITVFGDRSTPPWTWIYAFPFQGRMWSTQRSAGHGLTMRGLVPARPPALRFAHEGPRTVSVHVAGPGLLLIPHLWTIITAAVGRVT